MVLRGWKYRLQDEADENGGEPGGSAPEPKEPEEAGQESKSLSDEIARALRGKDHPDDPEGENPEEGKKPEEGEEAKEEDKTKEAADPYAEPEGLKDAAQATRDRFHDLVRMNKEKDEQLTRLQSDAQAFVEMVRDTGANSQQFVEALDLMSLIYHPERGNPEEASKRLYEMAKQLATVAGVPLPGVDFLEGYDDLRQKVEDREMSLEDAQEVAKLRNRQRAQEEARKHHERRQQQRQQATQSVEQATGQMAQWLKEIEGTDIDLKAKLPHLMEAAAYARENLYPQQWLGYMQREYEALGKLMQKRTPEQGPAPLRSSGNRSGTKQPDNMADAIKASIGLS